MRQNSDNHGLRKARCVFYDSTNGGKNKASKESNKRFYNASIGAVQLEYESWKWCFSNEMSRNGSVGRGIKWIIFSAPPRGDWF